MAGRSRGEGGNGKSGAEPVLAKFSAWIPEAFRSRMVDRSKVAPEEGGEGQEPRWALVKECIIGWGAAHGRNRRRCPKRERERKGTEVPPARATCSYQDVLLC